MILNSVKPQALICFMVCILSGGCDSQPNSADHRKAQQKFRGDLVVARHGAVMNSGQSGGDIAFTDAISSKPVMLYVYLTRDGILPGHLQPVGIQNCWIVPGPINWLGIDGLAKFDKAQDQSKTATSWIFAEAYNQRVLALRADIVSKSCPKAAPIQLPPQLIAKIAHPTVR